MQRQNHTVLRTASSYWVDAGPGVYQAFPYHWLISPSEEEVVQLFSDQHAIGIRYSAPLNVKSGALSYHVVYQEARYSLDSLSKKARHDVERGTSISTVEPISFYRLANEGWELRQETLIRQGRQHVENKEWWTNLCMSAEGLDGFEAWGAIVNKKLVAALFAFSCDDCFSILYHQSLTSYLPYGINNFLAYSVTREVLKRSGHPKLFYGIQSLDAPSSVDQFKFRMGYIAKPIRQVIEFHPLLRSFATPLSGTILTTVHKIFPSNRLFAKAAGMVQFYSQGLSRIV